MNRSNEEIEREIIAFLDENSTHKGDGTQPGCGLKHGIACALGTCKNNIPRVTPIDFYNDGLTLWMIGDPGGKLGNIRANPNVAVGIYTPIDHSKENRSIQLWGKASLITRRGQAELFTEITTKFGILDAMKQTLKGVGLDPASEEFEAKLDKLINSETLIKIEPEKIVMLIVAPDMKTEKLTWNRSRQS